MISYSIITPNDITDLMSQIDGAFYDIGDNLVSKINDAIFETSETYNHFSVSVEVRGLTEKGVPLEIMFLNKEFRGRGFFTEYKSEVIDEETVGRYIVSWSHPEMNFYDTQSRPYWNLTLLDMIGKNGKAYEYYLCLTGGVDLRSITQNKITHDIANKITVNALKGHRVFDYSGPDNIFNKILEGGNDSLITAKALSNLFEEAIDYVNSLDYVVSDATVPWTISSN